MGDKHWAEITADELIKKHRDKGKDFVFVCASGITPSGVVHAGNFREVATTYFVVKALEKKGKKVRFIYSWDDYDVFRKVPKNLPKQDMLKENLRKSITEVPDPYECHKSYAEHNEKVFEEELNRLGIKPEYIKQNEMYKKCAYAELIKTALDNVEKIKEILNKYRKEPLKEDWLPVRIFCGKCGRDNDKIKRTGEYEVEYTCQHCGFKEKIDFRKKGNIKLVWRVDWPARWSYEKVVFEPGGKDHSTYGGSYTTGKEIVKIFNWEAPYYVQYNFIGVKGQGGKMSSSKGNLLRTKDIIDVYGPEITLYIYASYRPNSEFLISFDMDVLKIYEDFDRLEERYYKGECDEKEKWVYELAMNMKPPKEKPRRIPFRHLCDIIQIKNYEKEAVISYFKERGYGERDVLERYERAVFWLKEYAPEEFKYTPLTEIKEFSEEEKEDIKALIEVIEESKDEEELKTKIFERAKKSKKGMKEFFATCYKAIIGKRRGPKLAAFIFDIGKERVINHLKNLIDKI